MSLRRAAFAIPGELSTATGGYIYERRLLEGLQAQGRDMRYLKLGPSFPDATRADMDDAVAQLQSLDPDRAVILDGFISATLDTDALAALHVPKIAMVHHPLALETGLSQARRDHLYRLERANFAHIDHVLVPSPATAATLTTSYGVDARRITIARPGTDRPTGQRVPADPPLILSVGIQHPRKGHDVLLKALAQITHLNWTAVIAGKVHDEAYGIELVRLSADLGLDHRVTLAGFVEHRDLAALYNAAHVFALATRYEGYGLVFDEALAYGVPVVSCATGAVPDTVPKGAGQLVAPDDPDAFASALAAMLEDTAWHGRCAAAARQAGLALPGWDTTARIAGQVIDAL